VVVADMCAKHSEEQADRGNLDLEGCDYVRRKNSCTLFAQT
jgi:hypothetical protein